jgi:hypothetical protein
VFLEWFGEVKIISFIFVPRLVWFRGTGRGSFAVAGRLIRNRLMKLLGKLIRIK